MVGVVGVVLFWIYCEINLCFVALKFQVCTVPMLVWRLLGRCYINIINGRFLGGR